MEKILDKILDKLENNEYHFNEINFLHHKVQVLEKDVYKLKNG